MKKFCFYNLVFIMLFFFNVLCYGMSGYELAKKVHDRYIGDNSKSIMLMILKNKSGYTRKRKFLSLFLEKNGIRKNFIRFLEPEDIAGTGFLSIEKKDGDTIQYLYLPALRRARRIVSSQKGNSFVNSDFSYEDMERRAVDDFIHKIVGKANIRGYDCFILESVPKPKTKTQYSLVRSYIPKDIFLSIKTEFYNKHRKLFKVLEVKHLEKIQNIWTPMELIMTNLDKKHSTIIQVKQLKYNTGEITDEMFTKRNLEDW